MPREYKLYLRDILDAIDKIEGFVGEMSADAVLSNNMSRDAVLYNLMVIGEAVKHVPEEVRAKYQHVEWRNIGRLRDFVAHEYFGINLEIVRDVLQNKLPELRRWIGDILDQEDQAM